MLAGLGELNTLLKLASAAAKLQNESEEVKKSGKDELIKICHKLGLFKLVKEKIKDEIFVIRNDSADGLVLEIFDKGEETARYKLSDYE